MKYAQGFFFPDYEVHFIEYLEKTNGVYQRAQRELGIELHTFLNFNKNLAIDIGANVGLWARPLSQEFSQVLAFEPYPSNFECLASNTESLRVKCINCALGSIRSSERLYVAKSVPNCGAASFVDFDDLAEEEKLGIDVAIHPLDSFGVLGVSLIKIDVQGYEEEVLRGARQTLMENACVLIVENWPTRSSISEILVDYGYCLAGHHTKENYFVPVRYAKEASAFFKRRSDLQNLKKKIRLLAQTKSSSIIQGG